MAVLRYFQALQLCLAILGAYLTWYLIFANGTAAQLQSFHSLEFLPGRRVPLRQTFTRVPIIDKQLKYVNCLIWLVVNEEWPGVLLHAYLFVGQLAATYGLLLLEGARYGNHGTLISYTVLWALLITRCGLSTTGPLLSAIHLFRSPTVTPSKSNIAIKAVDALSIVPAITCGYVLPSILVGLPSSSLVKYADKQTVMALWQAFPLWVSILNYGSGKLLSALFVPSTAFHPNKAQGPENMGALRLAYSFLILLAGVTHIHACGLSLTASISPQLFTPSAAKSLNFSNVFSPTATSPLRKVQSGAAGLALFLQWDEIIGLSAFFLWTLVLYIRAKHQKGLSMTPGLWLQLLVGSTIAGPTTAAAALMWARDELVMESKGEPKTHKSL